MTASVAGRPYVILVVFTVAPDRADEFQTIMSDSVADVRAVKGNRGYDLNRDPTDPGRFMLYEVFDDEAAWEAHHARPELQTLLGAIKPMLIGKPERSVWSGVSSR